MRSLSETLLSIEHLCFATKTVDEIDEKIEEYLKNYPHLKNPACIDLLKECVKTWHRIKKLEELENKTEDTNEYLALSKQIEKLTRVWLQMLASLGLTFTKQAYIKKKTDVVQPPFERLEMLTRKKKNDVEKY